MTQKKIFVTAMVELILLYGFYASGVFYNQRIGLIFTKLTMHLVCMTIFISLGATVAFAALKKDSVCRTIMAPTHAFIGALLVLSLAICSTQATFNVSKGACQNVFNLSKSSENEHISSDSYTSGAKATNTLCWEWLMWSCALLITGFLVGVAEFTMALGCATLVKEKKTEWGDGEFDEGMGDFNEDDFL